MTETILIKALVSDLLYDFHSVKNQQGLSHMLTHNGFKNCLMHTLIDKKIYKNLKNKILLQHNPTVF